jgi:hypothetical protein
MENNDEPSSINCKIFFDNLTKCVNNKKNIFGELKQTNNFNNLNNFNFFYCDEYKNFINNSR